MSDFWFFYIGGATCFATTVFLKVLDSESDDLGIMMNLITSGLTGIITSLVWPIFVARETVRVIEKTYGAKK